MPILSVILASAAVGALVSALATLYGQKLERAARKRELLLAKALELAEARAQRGIAAANQMGQSWAVEDNIVMAEGYFRWLNYMFDHGELPDEPGLQRLPRPKTP